MAFHEEAQEVAVQSSLGGEKTQAVDQASNPFSGFVFNALDFPPTCLDKLAPLSLIPSGAALIGGESTVSHVSGRG